MPLRLLRPLHSFPPNLLPPHLPILLPKRRTISSSSSSSSSPFTHLKQFQFQNMSSQPPPPPPPTPIFSSSLPSEKGATELSPLLVSNGGRWSLTSTRDGIERGFRFKGFKRCWEFMNHIAPECTRQKHHPEWSNLYNTTFIRWTTHSQPGISEKDILMARFCDDKARECGEVEVEVEVEETRDEAGKDEKEEGIKTEREEGKRDMKDEKDEKNVQGREDDGKGENVKGRELVDRVAKEGGDCCVPKKKKKMKD